MCRCVTRFVCHYIHIIIFTVSLSHPCCMPASWNYSMNAWKEREKFGNFVHSNPVKSTEYWYPALSYVQQTWRNKPTRSHPTHQILRCPTCYSACCLSANFTHIRLTVRKHSSGNIKSSTPPLTLQWEQLNSADTENFNELYSPILKTDLVIISGIVHWHWWSVRSEVTVAQWFLHY